MTLVQLIIWNCRGLVYYANRLWRSSNVQIDSVLQLFSHWLAVSHYISPWKQAIQQEGCLQQPVRCRLTISHLQEGVLLQTFYQLVIRIYSVRHASFTKTRKYYQGKKVWDMASVFGVTMSFHGLMLIVFAWILPAQMVSRGVMLADSSANILCLCEICFWFFSPFYFYVCRFFG